MQPKGLIPPEEAALRLEDRDQRSAAAGTVMGRTCRAISIEGRGALATLLDRVAQIHHCARAMSHPFFTLRSQIALIPGVGTSRRDALLSVEHMLLKENDMAKIKDLGIKILPETMQLPEFGGVPLLNCGPSCSDCTNIPFSICGTTRCGVSALLNDSDEDGAKAHVLSSHDQRALARMLSVALHNDPVVM